MDEVVAREKLDLGMARHVLRKCRRYRIRAIIPQVLQNFSFFAPVISDVVTYLRRVASERWINANVDEVVRVYREEAAIELPYLRMWFDEFVATKAAFLANPEVRVAVGHSPSFAARSSAAITLNDAAWFRAQRYNLDNVGAWDRRQIMRSSLAVGRDERRAWLLGIQNNFDQVLEGAVIRWLMDRS